MPQQPRAPRSALCTDTQCTTRARSSLQAPHQRAQATTWPPLFLRNAFDHTPGHILRRSDPPPSSHTSQGVSHSSHALEHATREGTLHSRLVHARSRRVRAHQREPTVAAPIRRVSRRVALVTASQAVACQSRGAASTCPRSVLRTLTPCVPPLGRPLQLRLVRGPVRDLLVGRAEHLEGGLEYGMAALVRVQLQRELFVGLAHYGRRRCAVDAKGDVRPLHTFDYAQRFGRRRVDALPPLLFGARCGSLRAYTPEARGHV